MPGAAGGTAWPRPIRARSSTCAMIESLLAHGRGGDRRRRRRHPGRTRRARRLAGRAGGGRQGPHLGAARRSLGIPDLLILTAVERVAINFGKPTQTLISTGHGSELKALPARRPFRAGQHGAEGRGGDPAYRRRRPARDHRPPRAAVLRRSPARTARMWFAASVAGRFAREALAAGEGEVCAVFRRSFYLRCPTSTMPASATPRSAAGRSTRWSPTSALPAARRDASRSPSSNAHLGSPPRAASGRLNLEALRACLDGTCPKKAWAACSSACTTRSPCTRSRRSRRSTTGSPATRSRAEAEAAHRPRPRPHAFGRRLPRRHAGRAALRRPRRAGRRALALAAAAPRRRAPARISARTSPPPPQAKRTRRCTDTARSFRLGGADLIRLAARRSRPLLRLGRARRRGGGARPLSYEGRGELGGVRVGRRHEHAGVAQRGDLARAAPADRLRCR